ncbi:MAG: hypothetical protein QXO51_04620 [Halobacteria archaeon]
MTCRRREALIATIALLALFVLLPFVVAWNLLHPARNRSLFVPTE